MDVLKLKLTETSGKQVIYTCTHTYTQTLKGFYFAKNIFRRKLTTKCY